MPIQNFVSYCLLSTLNNQMPESDINANIFSKYKINYLWKKMMNEGTEGEAIWPWVSKVDNLDILGSLIFISNIRT